MRAARAEASGNPPGHVTRPGANPALRDDTELRAPRCSPTASRRERSESA